VVGLAVFNSVSAFVWVAVTVAVDGFEVRPLPEAVAVLTIEPASISAWMIVCGAVQVVEAPGAKGPVPPLAQPTRNESR
jgi:hypothetical protein